MDGRDFSRVALTDAAAGLLRSLHAAHGPLMFRQSVSGRSSPGTASVMDRCVMKWSGAAPCQCSSSGGV
jgi:uncharacterized protein (DUF779 family)